MLPVRPCRRCRPQTLLIVTFLETGPSNRTTLPLRSGFPEAPCQTRIQLDEYYLLALGLLSLEQQHSVPPAVANLCMRGDSSDSELPTIGLQMNWYSCSGLYSIDRGCEGLVHVCYGGKAGKGALI